MRELIDKLKSERKTIEKSNLQTQNREVLGKARAFKTGKQTAKKWIQRATYQEIKDVLYRPNARHDANYFAFMRNIFFTSMEKRCPNVTEEFKWFHNDEFMQGWREGVITIWDSIREDVEGNVSNE